MTDKEKPASLDMDLAFLDPSSAFSTPEALLSHAGLSKDQKIEILRRWTYDASEIGVAVEEGMPDGESDLLRRIMLALNQLTGLDMEHVSPTKQHGIPRSAIKPD
jgi:hypothetical protein